VENNPCVFERTLFFRQVQARTLLLLINFRTVLHETETGILAFYL
jgi:hypothetical protein